MALSDFLVNTDYPLDKVVIQDSTSTTIPAYDFRNITVPHGLSFKPLPNAQWSLTPDFSVSYNISGGPISFIAAGRDYPTGISSSSTDVIITADNRTPNPVTLYFRYYGLMPSNIDGDAGFTEFSGDSFVLNTDYNYTKLVDASTVNVPTGNGTITIPHGLDYRPQVAAWAESSIDGLVSPIVVARKGVFAMEFFNIVVDSQNVLVVLDDNYAAQTLHYRIYGDAQ